ncbi:metal-dependent hydrolase [Chromatium okenii]|uniref:metal-dependent hydrolase n=1 Tax=Chromatium okenii TaxID=61644 RepID=UPI001904F8BF|nr:metal-dependent hydrolase [Chromatium okenii]MBK1640447.1 metal-dependent hydrolase [Chromatium okenii]
MANFQTHLNLGIVVSASAALMLHTAAVIDASHTLSFFVLGVVGSLLPDIDSKTSKPAAILFNLIGAGLAFAMTMPFFKQLPPLQLSLIWGGVYLIVRHGFLEIFSRITVHRGIWHSLLAVIVISLAMTNVAFWLWQESAAIAWLAGAMTGIGYLTHLVLDELYSVDLLNRRIKRSFGTALKPFSYTDRWSNLLMLMSILSLFWFAPSAAWLPVLQIEIPLPIPTLSEIEQYWNHIQRQF